MPKVRSSTSSAHGKPGQSAVVPQHGGHHYETSNVTGVCPHCGGEIQHWDLYADQPYLEAAASKYATRWRDKGGLEDLEKAITYLQKRLAIERLRARTAATQPVPPRTP